MSKKISRLKSYNIGYLPEGASCIDCDYSDGTTAPDCLMCNYFDEQFEVDPKGLCRHHSSFKIWKV